MDEILFLIGLSFELSLASNVCNIRIYLQKSLGSDEFQFKFLLFMF